MMTEYHQLKPRQIREILEIVEAHQAYLLEQWQNYQEDDHE
jgi:hypothetical protein